MKELETLVAGGALLSSQGSVFPVGAIGVRGDSVVWVEQGALSGNQVHRVGGVTLRSISADVVELWMADGSLYGVLERMDAGEAAEYQFEAFRAFLQTPGGENWRQAVNESVEQRLSDVDL